jgi:hypothetical protein
MRTRRFKCNSNFRQQPSCEPCPGFRYTPLTRSWNLSLRTKRRSPSLPIMAYHSDYVATDTYDQQSHRQIHRGRYEARLANYSPAEIHQSPAQGRHGHRMPFDSGCDLDHPVPSQSASYRLGGFFTPESFSATSPTSAIHWVPLSDDVPCPPDKSNVDMRKERRRAQNRMAQRGALLLLLRSIVS